MVIDSGYRDHAANKRAFTAVDLCCVYLWDAAGWWPGVQSSIVNFELVWISYMSYLTWWSEWKLDLSQMWPVRGQNGWEIDSTGAEYKDHKHGGIKSSSDPLPVSESGHFRFITTVGLCIAGCMVPKHLYCPWQKYWRVRRPLTISRVAWPFSTPRVAKLLAMSRSVSNLGNEPTGHSSYYSWLGLLPTVYLAIN